MNTLPTSYIVGAATIDTASRQILFQGEAVDVQPKVFDLLVYLIQHRDRVVSKDELFDTIWPSVVVSEASLTQLIKRTRDLFRQHGFELDIIRTVSRTGYQFDHPVETTASEPIPATGRRTRLALPVTAIVLLLLAAAVWLYEADSVSPVETAPNVPRNSLAVLPFNNLTPDAEFGYFTDGLTETVTNSLTRVAGLRVIASNSTANFRAEELNLGLLSQELRISHAVQGSVQRDGDNLRISARLIRLTDGTQLWSQLYTRQFDDIFALHDAISQEIVEQMSGVLSASLALPGNAELITGNADDSEAYRLLLQGQALRRNGPNQELATAETLFRRAISLKPDYADALVALSGTLRIRAVIGELPREATFSEALVLARQALELDPRHSAALVQIAEIQHRHFWEFADAADYYQRAIASSPGDAAAHAAYSRFLSKIGQQGAAVREARIAIDLDPLSGSAGSALTIRLIRAGDLEGARLALEAFKSRFPDHFDTAWLESNWHIRNGSHSDALQWIALEELDYLRLSLSAVALHFLGRTGQALQSLEQLIETDADGATFQIAEVYAQWQQPEQAFAWLDRAFEQGDPGLAELYSSVNLANLYEDPRFTALAERIGLPNPPASF